MVAIGLRRLDDSLIQVPPSVFMIAKQAVALQVLLAVYLMQPAFGYAIMHGRQMYSDVSRSVPFPKSIQSYTCSSLDGPSCPFLQNSLPGAAEVAVSVVQLDDLVDAALAASDAPAEGTEGAKDSKKPELKLEFVGAPPELQQAVHQIGAKVMDSLQKSLADTVDQDTLKRAKAGDATAKKQVADQMQDKLSGLFETVVDEAQGIPGLGQLFKSVSVNGNVDGKLSESDIKALKKQMKHITVADINDIQRQLQSFMKSKKASKQKQPAPKPRTSASDGVASSELPVDAPADAPADDGQSLDESPTDSDQIEEQDGQDGQDDGEQDEELDGDQENDGEEEGDWGDEEGDEYVDDEGVIYDPDPRDKKVLSL